MQSATVGSALGSADEGYNKGYVWMISVVAALGGLLFGYDWVVIGGAKPFYEKYFGLVEASQQGWAMSSALVGCLIGALVSASASDRFGRKRLLVFSAVLFTISSIGTGMANTLNVFVLWRIIGGIGIGVASTLSPLYIAEVSPASVRGKLVSINQFTVVIGILAAQIVNLLIADKVPADATADFILNSWNGQTGWRHMFYACAAPALVFVITSLLIPESPRWLAKAGRAKEARSILERIFGTAKADSVLREIESTLKVHTEKVQWGQLLEKRTLPILVIGIVLAVFQQWCGINVIFNYADEIFTNAGYGVNDILFNIVITGAVNVVASIAALALVDKVGRRPLMLFGAASLCVVYVILGACYAMAIKGPAVLALVLIAIACYAVTLAPVVWVIISEIFPNRIRGLAASVAVGALWVACFVLTYTFPLLNKALGAAGTFWIYAVICGAGFVFTYAKLPETKGKTLEEIERSF